MITEKKVIELGFELEEFDVWNLVFDKHEMSSTYKSDVIILSVDLELQMVSFDYSSKQIKESEVMQIDFNNIDNDEKLEQLVNLIKGNG